MVRAMLAGGLYGRESRDCRIGVSELVRSEFNTAGFLRSFLLFKHLQTSSSSIIVDPCTWHSSLFYDITRSSNKRTFKSSSRHKSYSLNSFKGVI